SGVTLPAMSPVTVSGTAADAGGGVVARVEVSTDNGATWQPATGLGSWSYSWTPTATGSYTIRVRSEDDSANVGSEADIPGTVGPGVNSRVRVGRQSCPCAVSPDAATPTKRDSGDGAAVNLGVKFTPAVSGAVTGVRFYKAETNTGTHIGSLWTSTGQLLGS